MPQADPALAADVHRWFAEVPADRLGDTLRAVDALTTELAPQRNIPRVRGFTTT